VSGGNRDGEISGDVSDVGEMPSGKGSHSSASQLDASTFRVLHASALRLDVSTFLGLFREFHRQKTSQVELRSGR